MREKEKSEETKGERQSKEMKILFFVVQRDLEEVENEKVLTLAKFCQIAILGIPALYLIY
jgi:hypothetical protein